MEEERRRASSTLAAHLGIGRDVAVVEENNGRRIQYELDLEFWLAVVLNCLLIVSKSA